MEGALIALAIKAGVDAEAARRDFPRLAEIPFDARHRFMATLKRPAPTGLSPSRARPNGCSNSCDRQRSASGDEPLDAPMWRGAIDSLAAKGQRVIAFASKRAAA